MDQGLENWHIYLQTVKSSHPYPIFILSLSGPYPVLIRSLSNPYPVLTQSLSGHYSILIWFLSYLLILCPHPNLWLEKVVVEPLFNVAVLKRAKSCRNLKALGKKAETKRRSKRNIAPNS